MNEPATDLLVHINDALPGMTTSKCVAPDRMLRPIGSSEVDLEASRPLEPIDQQTAVEC